jgi:hypothetical protein
MTPYRAALLALVVACAAFASAAPAGATSGVEATPETLGGPSHASETQADAPVAPEERARLGDAQATDENDSENDTRNDSALGADISSFLQSNVAETDGAVENGMWSAAFDGTENQSVRERLVERRTNELRDELAELHAEKEELLAEREAGNISETAYKARISRLAGQINALEASINATSSRAQTIDSDVEELNSLRTEAKNLSGPEVAAVARNVSGVGNGNDGQGPPDNPGNGNGNGADNGNGNGVGNVGDANNTTDASERGQPNDEGNAGFGDEENPGERVGDGVGDEQSQDGTQGNGDGSGENDASDGNADDNSSSGENANDDDGARGQDGTDGRDGKPGNGLRSIADPTQTDVFGGESLSATAEEFGGSFVSTVQSASSFV